MKALSISPDFAFLIFAGEKTIENRTWQTDYRGDILICSTAKKIKDTIPSHALCVASLSEIVQMKRSHLKDACLPNSEYNKNSFAWKLENIRFIKPFEVKGKLSLWECNHEIEYLPITLNDLDNDEIFNRYYGELFV